MTRRLILHVMLAALAAFYFSAAFDAVAAKDMPSTLTGQVTSQEEGAMEGVLVSAKKDGSTVTVTVVSDAQGRYSFPAQRLAAGRYGLKIRAVGYDLAVSASVDVVEGKSTQADLRLVKTKDLAAQLTNSEWFMSWPGTAEQKMAFSECITCHTVEKIVRSRYTAAEFPAVVERMRNWASGSTPPFPVKRLHPRPGGHLPPAHAEYLASINLSGGPAWRYPLKTLPRPTGAATRVIVTTYDLIRPNTSPHDVVVAPDGMIWYCDFGQPYIGMLDPKTAKVVEYEVPRIKANADTGMNNIEMDDQGNIFIAMFNQAGLVKFDTKTKKFQTWPIPKELDANTRRTVFIASMNHAVNDKVWIGGGMDRMYRIDLKTGKWELMDEQKDLPKDSPIASRPHGIYGLASDSQNNLYELDIKSEYIIKVDAKTLKATYYQTPTMNSGPRRGRVDSKDRLWFAEHMGQKIGMFDTKAERFQEWAVPTPFTNPYDAVADRNDEVWMGGMGSDRITRLNSKSGAITEYLMPRFTNVRRVDVDNSTTPVTFWVGDNDGAAILKVEPME